MSTVSKVLLIDDEPDVLEVLEVILRHEPYATRCATSAAEAREILSAEPIDVVVTDESMPHTSGTVFLEEVAQDYPSTVRIVLTGRASVDSALRAINQARVFRFLEKPCPPDVLRDCLRDALELRSQHDPTNPGAGESLQLKPAVAALLTTREVEVLELLNSGRRVSSIARELFISPHTVRNHLKSMFRKLEVHSQEELITRARFSGKN